MTAGRMRGVELLLDRSLHAYDPHADKTLFEGVLQRRTIALMIDLFTIAVPVGVIGLLVFMFCTLSLRMDWTLLWLLVPLSIVWALICYSTHRRAGLGDNGHAGGRHRGPHVVRGAVLPRGSALPMGSCSGCSLRR
jgi:hypothetical protein